MRSYQPKDRLRLAWHWLPVEVLILALFLAGGWGVNRVIAKPVYQSTVELTIRRRYKKGQSRAKRVAIRQKDIDNVGQFNVMPRQAAVLFKASEYAYTHYGIWQPIQDLSESVSAVAIPQKPVLQLTVVSSSKQVAQRNVKAFNIAVKDSLSKLKGYQVSSSKLHTKFIVNNVQRTVYKFAGVLGALVAVTTPYLIKTVREDRDELVVKTKK